MVELEIPSKGATFLNLTVSDADLPCARSVTVTVVGLLPPVPVLKGLCDKCYSELISFNL